MSAIPFDKEWMENIACLHAYIVLGPGMWVFIKERQKINGNFMVPNHV
ncbi:hypothetical protein J23TS9_32900 [Paenibacillus sp. J23TS9]|nr:hypothetical protein J23TS9_32900 [Paenibacillus sp. J23TS9]